MSTTFVTLKTSISSVLMSNVTGGRSPWTWLILISFSVSLAVCTSERAQEHRFQVRGVFLGQRFEGVAMRVRHEAIPGYMEAMAMDFKLADPAELEDLSPGDKISFVYVVTEDDSYAEDLRVLPPETRLELDAVETR